MIAHTLGSLVIKQVRFPNPTTTKTMTDNHPLRHSLTFTKIEALDDQDA
jgi:hypothetical protein